jgi:hypothetical protein
VLLVAVDFQRGEIAARLLLRLHLNRPQTQKNLRIISTVVAEFSGLRHPSSTQRQTTRLGDPSMANAFRFALVATVLLSATASLANAACMNKFVYRSEGPKQHITLLTGKMTFQEAQTLSKAISDKKNVPIEWIDEKGKVIAKQFGELKVVRPMPVGCDDKESGVVLNAIFMTLAQPSKKMFVKFDDSMTVEFEEQGK